MAKKKGKFSVSMFSFSLLPNPLKDLKFLQRLESIKKASQKEEVLHKLKILA